MKKIIVAILLIAILIPLIIVGGNIFNIAIGLICAMAYKELTDVKKDKKIPEFIKVLGLICLVYLVYVNNYNVNLPSIELWTLGVLLLIMLVPVIFYNNKIKYNQDDAFSLIGIILLIGISFNAILFIRGFSLKYFALVVLIPVLTDTFAQIFGGLLGSHKLTKISPNKTWEGAIFGSLLSTFICSVIYYNFIGNASLGVAVCLIFIMTVAGQLGDLFFSYIKRINGVKDFSNLIPGHGGVLDRIDSFIFVVITFILLCNYL